MDLSVLVKSALFSGVPEQELSTELKQTPHRIARYGKGETVFRLLQPAGRIGIVLEGRVEAQKTFENGSQVNVSSFGPGSLIGAAAAFSKSRTYPCDVVAAEPAAVLLIKRDDLTRLMQKDARILLNLTSEIASAAYMLQQRLELLSYSGIAQKAAFWLLTEMRRTGNEKVRIPESVSAWALRMNVSRPSLHRELRKLANCGAISYDPPYITVRDPGALQDALSD